MDAGLSEFLDLAPRLGHHLFARGNGFGLVRDSIRERFHPSETFLEAFQELDFVLDVIDVALLLRVEPSARRRARSLL